MLSTAEKKLIHIYARAAELSGPEYCALLSAETGKRSCADPEFSHSDADRVLAALEAVAWDRIRTKRVRVRSRWIRKEFYFRDRLSGGHCFAARRLWKIRRLWMLLAAFLPEADRSDAYLSGIVRQAVGRSVALSDLTPAESVPVLNALQDRLAWAVRARKN